MAEAEKRASDINRVLYGYRPEGYEEKGIRPRGTGRPKPPPPTSPGAASAPKSK